MFRYFKENIVTVNKYMESLNRKIEAIRNKVENIKAAQKDTSRNY